MNFWPFKLFFQVKPCKATYKAATMSQFGDEEPEGSFSIFYAEGEMLAKQGQYKKAIESFTKVCNNIQLHMYLAGITDTSIYIFCSISQLPYLCIDHIVDVASKMSTAPGHWRTVHTHSPIGPGCVCVPLLILCISFMSVLQALEFEPEDKLCLVARSKCYLRVGNATEALKDAEESLKEDQKYHKVQYLFVLYMKKVCCCIYLQLKYTMSS